MRQEPSAEVVMMTPEWAAELLAKSTGNRVISRTRVDRYAASMNRGEWKLNGEAIILDHTGAPQGGHHRLTACIKAGVPFPTLLVQGMAMDTYLTLDLGKPQSASDKLSREKIPNYRLITSAGRLVMLYERGVAHLRGGGTQHPSASEIYEWCKASLAEIDAAVVLAREVYKGCKSVSQSCFGAGHFLYHRIDAGLAENFARQVETGAHLTENSAALQLRNKLWSSKAAEHRMQADVEFAWILNAIAFDLEGSKRKKIRWWTPGSGLWPYLKQLPPTVQPYPWIELP